MDDIAQHMETLKLIGCLFIVALIMAASCYAERKHDDLR